MMRRESLCGCDTVLNVLVLTPSNKGGSWKSTKLLLDALQRQAGRARFTVCSGRLHSRIKDRNYRNISLDAIDVYRVQDSLAGFILFPLLYMIVGICGLIECITLRPRIVVVNGVAPLLTLLPCRLLGRGQRPLIVLEYHGALENLRAPRFLLSLLRAVFWRIVDVAVVNSVGSREDLAALVPRQRIVVIEHPISPVFFNDFDRVEARKVLGLDEDEFIVLFVGHLTFEKGLDVLLRVARRLAAEEQGEAHNIRFVIVGDGRLRGVVERLAERLGNIRYEGYVAEPERLALYYAAADVVWSYADTTYLARPAAEALAVGTPVIVPDLPAVLWKRLSGRRVPRSLVEPPVGFVVDSSNVEGIARFLLSLARRSDPLRYRSTVRGYARRRYNPLRLDALARVLLRKVGCCQG